MKHVEKYTYLGNVISSDGKFTMNIEKRRMTAHQSIWDAERENVRQETNKPEDQNKSIQCLPTAGTSVRRDFMSIDSNRRKKTRHL